ncbi:hypothetical protein [Accumulibacter sp.]|uniref:hypothetical protein n=1 Tax=Accumulibacter sp. TaxID=2053492 RepID=UPI00262D6AA4|nr:hypothetical protein [Accumulibacter sp.]
MFHGDVLIARRSRAVAGSVVGHPPQALSVHGGFAMQAGGPQRLSGGWRRFVFDWHSGVS